MTTILLNFTLRLKSRAVFQYGRGKRITLEYITTSPPPSLTSQSDHETKTCDWVVCNPRQEFEMRGKARSTTDVTNLSRVNGTLSNAIGKPLFLFETKLAI